jgi:thymidylate kinase
MAFLDTPLETCLTRVDARRAARGDGPLEDQSNIIKDFKAVQRARQRAVQMGFRVVDIDHNQPFNQIEALLDALRQLALTPTVDNGTGEGPPRVRATTSQTVD